ncbi:hypothetical protein RQN30_03030 [Arcanobacterium hippocoleae]
MGGYRAMSVVERLLEFAVSISAISTQEEQDLRTLLKEDGATAPFSALADLVEESRLQLPKDLLRDIEVLNFDEEFEKQILSVQVSR